MSVVCLKNHVEQSFPFLCLCALVKHSKDVRVGSGWILECSNSAQGIFISWSQLPVEEILWSNNIILFSFKFNIFMFCVPALFTASTLSLLNLPYVNNASLNFSRFLCLRLVFTSDGVRVGVGAGVVIRSIELMIEWKQRSDSTYVSVTYVPLMT